MQPFNPTLFRELKAKKQAEEASRTGITVTPPAASAGGGGAQPPPAGAPTTATPPAVRLPPPAKAGPSAASPMKEKPSGPATLIAGASSTGRSLSPQVDRATSVPPPSSPANTRTGLAVAKSPAKERPGASPAREAPGAVTAKAQNVKKELTPLDRIKSAKAEGAASRGADASPAPPGTPTATSSTIVDMGAASGDKFNSIGASSTNNKLSADTFTAPSEAKHEEKTLPAPGRPMLKPSKDEQKREEHKKDKVLTPLQQMSKMSLARDRSQTDALRLEQMKATVKQAEEAKWQQKEGELYTKALIGWNKKFCLLTEHALYICKKRGAKPDQEIPLPSEAYLEFEADVGKPHAFSVSSSRDEGTVKTALACESDEEREAWFESFKQLQAGKNKNINSESLREDYFMVRKPKASAWHMRYCILLPDKLLVLRKKRDLQPEDEIPLPMEAQVTTEEDDKKQAQTSVFGVAQSGDEGTPVFLFAANDGTRRKLWAHTISEITNARAKQKVAKSLQEGYIQVKKPGSSAWHVRYAVVLADRVKYFKRIHDDKEEAEVLLPTEAQVDNEEGDPEQKFVFSVAASGDEGTKKTMLACNEMEEKLVWMKTLNDVITKDATKINMNSLKEGYMRKLGEKGKDMHIRYFVLLSDRLQYFKKRNDKKPQGELPLPSETQIEIVNNIKFGFSVASSGDEGTRKFIFSTKNDREWDQWLKILCETVELKEKRMNSRSVREGYAQFRPRDGGAWHIKYLILTDTQLAYYKHKRDKKEEGVVLLPTEAQVDTKFDANELKDMVLNQLNSAHAFAVAPSGDEGTKGFLFAAKDEKDREGWVKDLHTLLATKVKKVNPASLMEGYVDVSKDKHYHTRYVILLDNEIQFFKKRNDPKSKEDVIPLPSEAEVSVETDSKEAAKTETESYPYTLSVAPSGDEGTKHTYLGANSVEQGTAWTTALTNAINKKEKKAYDKSLFEGYILVRKPKTKEWHKRYVVLMTDKLDIYKKKRGEKAEGEILLPAEAEVDVINDEPGERFVFSVAPSGDQGTKKHHFSAPAGDVRDTWLLALSDLLATKVVKANTASLREGYLNVKKKGAWRRVFIVLLNDKLLIYTKRNDPKEEEAIALPAEAEFVKEQPDGKEKEGQFPFSVAPSGDEGVQPILFGAKDTYERDGWLKMLHELLATKEHKLMAASRKEDYLYVCRPGKKDWHKRYCVLLADRLLYFKHKRDDKEEDSIALPAEGQVEREEDDTENKVFYNFSIASSGDEGSKVTLFAGVETGEEKSAPAVQRTKWIEAVTAILTEKQKKVDPKSLLEGYLNVRKAGSSSWQARFCILTREKLRVLKKRNEEEEEDIPLPSEAQIDEEEKEADAQFVFSVSPSGDEGTKKTMFSPRHEADKTSWFKAISDLIHSKVEKVNAKSLREGYLSVRLDKGDTRLAVRYTVLLQDRLVFYKKKYDPKPQGEIALPSEAQVELDTQFPSAFSVAPSGDEGTRDYVFAGRTDHERDEWFKALSDLITSKLERVVPGSFKEGYLMKKKGYKNAYYPRFVILLPDKIEWRKVRTDANTTQEIPLSSEAKVSVVDDDKTVEWLFLVSTSSRRNGKRFLFAARSEVQRDQWVNAIKDIIAGFNLPQLFEGDLTNGVERSKDHLVPEICFQCIEKLKDTGLEVEGIFRVPGNNDKIQELRAKFERGLPCDLSDPHSVAGVLKLYYRLLADSLVPRILYTKWLKIEDGRGLDGAGYKLPQLIAVMHELDKPNRDNLNYLLHFLTLVADRSDVNKMTSANCAMVFAPSVLRKIDEDADDVGNELAKAKAMVAEFEKVQSLIQIIIEGYAQVFPEGPPVGAKGSYKKPKKTFEFTSPPAPVTPAASVGTTASSLAIGAASTASTASAAEGGTPAEERSPWDVDPPAKS